MKRDLMVAGVLVLCCTAGAETSVSILDSHRSVAPSVKEWQFHVPTFSVEHQVRLRLEARIDFRRLAGSNHWLRAAVNGTYLTKPDLLNKPNEFRLRRGIDLLWVTGDRWRVLYSPDFQAAIKASEGKNLLLRVRNAERGTHFLVLKKKP